MNCVWDRYRDELEEWAAAQKEANYALRKGNGFDSEKMRRNKKGLSRAGLLLGRDEEAQTSASIDDDGGGSESNWGTGVDTALMNEDLFKGVPVGIREFMKQEKKLKEKHAKEGTVG